MTDTRVAILSKAARVICSSSASSTKVGTWPMAVVLAMSFTRRMSKRKDRNMGRTSLY